MNPVSKHTVYTVLEKMNSATPKEIKNLVNQLAKEQPELLFYLLTVNDEIYTESEREELIYLGLIIWQVMTQEAKSVVQITAEDIIEAENANYLFIASFLQKAKEDYMLAIDNFFKNYNQPALLNFVVEALMDEDLIAEEGSEVDEEPQTIRIRRDVKGHMLFSLKTVIDCLDKKQLILP